MCGAAVLLIQALSAWNDAHGGRLPASAEEKAQFRALLMSWQRSTDGVLMQVRVGHRGSLCLYEFFRMLMFTPLQAFVPMQEENFEEALAHVRKVFSPPTIRA